ncbi:MAG: methylthioadenosine phosphorylase [Bacteroidetes bacterium GWC2_33_15]|nr:MAG: methylthioadenosine phosphorylase [Bacteroidetes bacterium GWA2_33_15]OFX52675.1 MAG: methylthioadenosine phosphorylase [Bacteroidetes bacterium GWC2_33_15]OFX64019.1 MAG: methylthioadenosine phosphorylase [Bacteroidetes bacterium GWB2_32_14]OFX67296.1 MAG: methylthioadenosine phosphorylase [Bacteroidetes bacterium GWD2_33_33]HAN18843.1 S-methyl-5'-thioadenosine phosphorylase [Bacteroidales bacterium]
MTKVAIIGGSGLENPDILKLPQIIKVKTPFGEPSSELTTGKIGNMDVVILSRHGKKHTIPPTQVNNRANIWALKEQGCEYILATTACGSLRQEINRGDLVIPDQFIDFTRHRKVSFFEEFENGDMKHTVVADPFNKQLRNFLILSATELNLKFHKQGTVVTIEGPRFSTRAESNMFRSWGADVINMSTAPEAILANEIGIPYAAIAMSTDYDCWKTDEEPVTWEEIIEIFEQNVHHVIELILRTLQKLEAK